MPLVKGPFVLGTESLKAIHLPSADHARPSLPTRTPSGSDTFSFSGGPATSAPTLPRIGISQRSPVRGCANASLEPSGDSCGNQNRLLATRICRKLGFAARSRAAVRSAASRVRATACRPNRWRRSWGWIPKPSDGISRSRARRACGSLPAFRRSRAGSGSRRQAPAAGWPARRQERFAGGPCCLLSQTVRRDCQRNVTAILGAEATPENEERETLDRLARRRDEQALRRGGVAKAGVVGDKRGGAGLEGESDVQGVQGPERDE
jgi:hypothetical protein